MINIFKSKKELNDIIKLQNKQYDKLYKEYSSMYLIEREGKYLRLDENAFNYLINLEGVNRVYRERIYEVNEMNKND